MLNILETNPEAENRILFALDTMYANRERYFRFLSRFFVVGTSLLGFTVIAFGESPQDVTSTTKEVLAVVIAGSGVMLILGNVVWSFFNRKKYDKLQETISELEKLLEIRKIKSDEQGIRISELQVKLDLELKTRQDLVAGLTDTNISVTRENMQMRAILKMLRLEGKWLGDEEDVWKGYLVKP